MKSRFLVQTALIMALVATVGCGGQGVNNFTQSTREATSSPLSPQARGGHFDAHLVSPEDTALGVPVDAVIELDFTLVPATTNAATLLDPIGPLATHLVCNATRRCELIPNVLLDADTPYQVVVPAGTLSSNGVAMQHSRVWDFRTAPAGTGTAVEVVPLVPVKYGTDWVPGVRVEPLGGTADVTLSIGNSTDGPWRVSRATSLFKTATVMAARTTHTLVASLTPVSGGTATEFALPFSIGWTDVTPATVNGGLNDVVMLSHQLGWTAGDAGTLLVTHDGGHNWDVSHAGGADLTSLAFIAPHNGFAVGTGGTMLHTADGISWNTVAIATTATLRDILFIGADIGWAVGDGGTVLKSLDGGIIWEPVTIPGGANITGIDCLDEARCIIVGSAGTILATRDGGNHWTAFDGGTRADLNNVTLSSDGTGWISAKNGLLLTGGFIDGWWLRGATGQTYLAGMTFTKNGHGWAAGTGNSVIATRNNGTTWFAQPLPFETALAAISARDAGYLVAVGRDASGRPVILRTDTGGAS